MIFAACTAHKTTLSLPTANQTTRSNEPDIKKLANEVQINDLTPDMKNTVTLLLQQIFREKITYTKKQGNVSVFEKDINLHQLTSSEVRNLNLHFSVYKYYPGAHFLTYTDDGGNQEMVRLDDQVKSILAGESDGQISSPQIKGMSSVFRKFGNRLFLQSLFLNRCNIPVVSG